MAAARRSGTAGPEGLFGKLVQGGDATSTPAITNPQILAIAQAFLAVIVVFGFDVNDDQRNVIIAVSTALAAALPASDAAIRRTRAQNAPAIADAQLKARHPKLATELERKRLEAEIAKAQAEIERARAGLPPLGGGQPPP